MAGSGSGTARVPRPRRGSSGGAALLALASLGVALAVGWWIATQADLLGIRFDHAYYVLLVILGLAAAAFLFGVLRSSATLTGSHLGVGFEVGGAAALFLLVVWGGAYFTSPPESFSSMVRLRYAGPPADRAAFDEALPSARLIVRFGSNTRTPEISRLGEAEIRDVPGRFRAGTITVELVSDRIELVAHDVSTPIPMPSRDTPAELRAVLREPEERRAARKRARADLERAIAASQRGLMAQSGFLFPAIDQFLASPSEDGWARVLTLAERVRVEIDRGFEAALDYDSRYGGLLAQPHLIRASLVDTRERLSAPQVTYVREQDSSPAPPRINIFERVYPEWTRRDGVLRNTPDPSSLREVRAWRERLQLAHDAVRQALEPIAAQLREGS